MSFASFKGLWQVAVEASSRDCDWDSNVDWKVKTERHRFEAESLLRNLIPSKKLDGNLPTTGIIKPDLVVSFVGTDNDVTHRTGTQEQS